MSSQELLVQQLLIYSVLHYHYAAWRVWHDLYVQSVQLLSGACLTCLGFSCMLGVQLSNITLLLRHV